MCHFLHAREALRSGAFIRAGRKRVSRAQKGAGSSIPEGGLSVLPYSGELSCPLPQKFLAGASPPGGMETWHSSKNTQKIKL